MNRNITSEKKVKAYPEEVKGSNRTDGTGIVLDDGDDDDVSSISSDSSITTRSSFSDDSDDNNNISFTNNEYSDMNEENVKKLKSNDKFDINNNHIKKIIGGVRRERGEETESEMNQNTSNVDNNKPKRIPSDHNKYILDKTFTSPDTLHFDGILIKEGANVKSWKPRYMLLYYNRLEYYSLCKSTPSSKENEKKAKSSTTQHILKSLQRIGNVLKESENTQIDTSNDRATFTKHKLKGSIELRKGVQVGEAPERGFERCFKIITSSRCYYLIAQNDELFDLWISKIRQILFHQNRSNSDSSIKSSSSSTPHFTLSNVTSSETTMDSSNTEKQEKSEFELKASILEEIKRQVFTEQDRSMLDQDAQRTEQEIEAINLRLQKVEEEILNNNNSDNDNMLNREELRSYHKQLELRIREHKEMRYYYEMVLNEIDLILQLLQKKQNKAPFKNIRVNTDQMKYGSSNHNNPTKSENSARYRHSIHFTAAPLDLSTGSSSQPSVSESFRSPTPSYSEGGNKSTALSSATSANPLAYSVVLNDYYGSSPPTSPINQVFNKSSKGHAFLSSTKLPSPKLGSSSVSFQFPKTSTPTKYSATESSMQYPFIAKYDYNNLLCAFLETFSTAPTDSKNLKSQWIIPFKCDCSLEKQIDDIGIVNSSIKGTIYILEHYVIFNGIHYGNKFIQVVPILELKSIEIQRLNSNELMLHMEHGKPISIIEKENQHHTASDIVTTRIGKFSSTKDRHDFIAALDQQIEKFRVKCQIKIRSSLPNSSQETMKKYDNSYMEDLSKYLSNYEKLQSSNMDKKSEETKEQQTLSNQSEILKQLAITSPTSPGKEDIPMESKVLHMKENNENSTNQMGGNVFPVKQIEKSTPSIEENLKSKHQQEENEQNITKKANMFADTLGVDVQTRFRKIFNKIWKKHLKKFLSRTNVTEKTSNTVTALEPFPEYILQFYSFRVSLGKNKDIKGEKSKHIISDDDEANWPLRIMSNNLQSLSFGTVYITKEALFFHGYSRPFHPISICLYNCHLNRLAAAKKEEFRKKWISHIEESYRWYPPFGYLPHKSIIPLQSIYSIQFIYSSHSTSKNCSFLESILEIGYYPIDANKLGTSPLHYEWFVISKSRNIENNTLLKRNTKEKEIESDDDDDDDDTYRTYQNIKEENEGINESVIEGEKNEQFYKVDFKNLDEHRLITDLRNFDEGDGNVLTDDIEYFTLIRLLNHNARVKQIVMMVMSAWKLISKETSQNMNQLNGKLNTRAIINPKNLVTFDWDKANHYIKKNHYDDHFAKIYGENQNKEDNRKDISEFQEISSSFKETMNQYDQQLQNIDKEIRNSSLRLLNEIEQNNEASSFSSLQLTPPPPLYLSCYEQLNANRTRSSSLAATREKNGQINIRETIGDLKDQIEEVKTEEQVDDEDDNSEMSGLIQNEQATKHQECLTSRRPELTLSTNDPYVLFKSYPKLINKKYIEIIPQYITLFYTLYCSHNKEELVQDEFVEQGKKQRHTPTLSRTSSTSSNCSSRSTTSINNNNLNSIRHVSSPTSPSDESNTSDGAAMSTDVDDENYNESEIYLNESNSIILAQYQVLRMDWKHWRDSMWYLEGINVDYSEADCEEELAVLELLVRQSILNAAVHIQLAVPSVASQDSEKIEWIVVEEIPVNEINTINISKTEKRKQIHILFKSAPRTLPALNCIPTGGIGFDGSGIGSGAGTESNDQVKKNSDLTMEQILSAIGAATSKGKQKKSKKTGAHESCIKIEASDTMMDQICGWILNFPTGQEGDGFDECRGLLRELHRQVLSQENINHKNLTGG